MKITIGTLIALAGVLAPLAARGDVIGFDPTTLTAGSTSSSGNAAFYFTANQQITLDALDVAKNEAGLTVYLYQVTGGTGTLLTSTQVTASSGVSAEDSSFYSQKLSQAITLGAGLEYAVVAFGTASAYYSASGTVKVLDPYSGITWDGFAVDQSTKADLPSPPQTGGTVYFGPNFEIEVSPPGGSSVPDGGSTLVMLGLAMSGCGYLRRRLA